MARLLTVEEVARRLRVHPMTVRRHIKSGRLRATRFGRSVRVPEDALEDAAPVREMTVEELIAKLRERPTPDELERRREVSEQMKRLQVPIDIPTDVLIRVGRRFRDVTGGLKTMEELVAEES